MFTKIREASRILTGFRTPVPFLPKPGLMDTIYVTDFEYSRRYPDEVVPAPRVVFGILLCNHNKTIIYYVRIDHRAGPGSFADNFEGKACSECARILEERQTL